MNNQPGTAPALRPRRHVRRRERRNPFLVAVTVIAITLLAIGGIGLLITLTNQPSPTAPTDMRGAAVTLDPNVTPIPTASSHAVDDGHGRLIVPAVQLDVALGALDAVDGQITPPGFASAYLVRNAGVSVTDTAHGTILIVMHSLRGGGQAPGNFLANAETGQPRVTTGDTINVSGTKFTTVSSRLINRTDLPTDAETWANTPNRLLLITCLQYADGSPATKNLVITAERTRS